jgi:hypothetical protein
MEKESKDKAALDAINAAFLEGKKQQSLCDICCRADWDIEAENGVWFSCQVGMVKDNDPVTESGKRDPDDNVPLHCDGLDRGDYPDEY